MDSEQLTNGFAKYMSAYAFFDTFGLRFTQPKHLNDRQECRPDYDYGNIAHEAEKRVRHARNRWRERIRNRQPHLTGGAIRAIVRPEEEKLRRRFSSNPENYKRLVMSTFRRQVNRLGVLSLSKVKHDPAMWAYYAVEGKGFMIVLNPDASVLRRRHNDLKGCGEIRPVIYSNERAVVAVRWDDFEIPESIFWRKELAWKSEQEVRLIREVSNADLEPVAGLFLWKLERGDLRELHFGWNIDAEVKATCVAKTRAFDAGVDLYDMRFDDDTGGMSETVIPQ